MGKTAKFRCSMGGCLPFASHKAFKGALVLGALMGIVDLFLPHFQIGAVIQLSGSSDFEYSSSSTSNACSADFDQAACDAAKGYASVYCNATYEYSSLADGYCADSCNFAECEYECGDCDPERRSLLDTPSESSADRVFAFDTGAEDFGFLDMVKAFRTEAQKHFAKVAAKHDRAVQRGRSLQEDTLRGGIKLSLGPVISSCNLFLEKNGEKVSTDDDEFADDIAEMEATCTQLASSVGTYLMAFVPWAAIATGLSVFCFFKSEKKKCACNCDNFTCCPINGLVWAIVHVCALLFLQNLMAPTLKAMNGSESSTSEDEAMDSEFRTYARWGFGFTFSIITNFFCILCCLVLACMVKEKDGEGTNVDTSPVAAGAVPVQAVAVSAQV